MKGAHFLLHWWRSLFACLFIMQITTARAKTKIASVDIHGVTDGAEVFNHTVERPAGSLGDGGAAIDAGFEAAALCGCDLQKRWQPGTRVRINTTRWLPREHHGSLTEARGTYMVEQHPYVEGEPDALSVAWDAGATVREESGADRPDISQPPAGAQGWPMPSLEFRKWLWDKHAKYAAGCMRLYQEMLTELEQAPETRATTAWNFAREFDHASLHGYSGPADPRYRALLKQEYAVLLDASEIKLKQLMQSRP